MCTWLLLGARKELIMQTVKDTNVTLLLPEMYFLPHGQDTKKKNQEYPQEIASLLK